MSRSDRAASGPGATRTASAASSSARRVSTAAWVASSSLRPPAANSLTPLSANGLCDAVIIAAGARRTTLARAIAGVGTTPASRTVAPAAVSPSARACSNAGPLSRVSRPMIHSPAPSTSAAARPSSVTNAVVSSVCATPRTPSVPKRTVDGDADWRISAWCTAWPCAP